MIAKSLVTMLLRGRKQEKSWGNLKAGELTAICDEIESSKGREFPLAVDQTISVYQTGAKWWQNS